MRVGRDSGRSRCTAAWQMHRCQPGTLRRRSPIVGHQAGVFATCHRGLHPRGCAREVGQGARSPPWQSLKQGKGSGTHPELQREQIILPKELFDNHRNSYGATDLQAVSGPQLLARGAHCWQVSAAACLCRALLPLLSASPSATV